MSRVSLLVATTPAQSRQMILLLAGGMMVMDKSVFRADWAASRVLLLVNTTLVRSKPMTVFSAGGMVIMDKALFPLD